MPELIVVAITVIVFFFFLVALAFVPLMLVPLATHFLHMLFNFGLVDRAILIGVEPFEAFFGARNNLILGELAVAAGIELLEHVLRHSLRIWLVSRAVIAPMIPAAVVVPSVLCVIVVIVVITVSAAAVAPTFTARAVAIIIAAPLATAGSTSATGSIFVIATTGFSPFLPPLGSFLHAPDELIA